MAPHKRGCLCSQRACAEARVEQAFLLRDSILHSYAWGNVPKLQTLARALLRFRPCAGALSVTGLGRLLGDRAVWADAAVSSAAIPDLVPK